ncbi:hypothetical protein J8273_1769 [Carpediemonas membranifera]|uniref:Uncharacterized protein n=1 Tax=Carpediemonas membranifera TaxID=201153 RepID=A0A8J6AWQ0_9EUKA|nr:hypothetical protein J8273_1769 [Carpediemonas membranifera]|eukprot:KAG9396751.1 hypothetical protein J8273_1769 [Carpediemonas membranifera]
MASDEDERMSANTDSIDVDQDVDATGIEADKVRALLAGFGQNIQQANAVKASSAPETIEEHLADQISEIDEPIDPIDPKNVSEVQLRTAIGQLRAEVEQQTAYATELSSAIDAEVERVLSKRRLLLTRHKALVQGQSAASVDTRATPQPAPTTEPFDLVA